MSLFPEEQLDSPVGYFPAQLGQTLKDGQWTITRKLGWGSRSSTWLALDNKKEARYGAIKILTVAATDDSTGKKERDFLLGHVKNMKDGVPEFRSHFYERDIKGKQHLCLVFDVLSTSVEDLRLTNIYDGEYLPVHFVKKVMGDVAKILVKLSEQKIIHGALTPDNFLFDYGVEIQKILGKFPKEKGEKIQGSDGITYPSVKSQPIPHNFSWDRTEDDVFRTEVLVYLCNYAHARPIGGSATLSSPKNFLPPEALQGGKIDLKSDIWTLGCTAYLLLTGTPLFSDSYIASPVKTATETLGKLESLLAENGKIPEKDIQPTISFLRSCLAIKPTKRASAEELVHGGWIEASDWACSCGWHGW